MAIEERLIMEKHVDFIHIAFEEHLQVLVETKGVCEKSLARLIQICTDSLARGGKLLFFGNGGSAADAQHLATELTIRYKVNRRALAAVALTTDSSVLTAAANDIGFEEVFARQIEALGRSGDVAIGISTSGKSSNVLKGLKQARVQGLVAAGFTGNNGGEMSYLADPLVIVPSQETSRIQEMHILMGHILCNALEQNFSQQREV